MSTTNDERPTTDCSDQAGARHEEHFSWEMVRDRERGLQYLPPLSCTITCPLLGQIAEQWISVG
ncbi:MAG: hypothetical protein M3380_07380, partial [Chloroflexota bacterium]|nr:hypothetical protein [Chloroflexota bacterium]